MVPQRQPAWQQVLLAEGVIKEAEVKVPVGRLEEQATEENGMPGDPLQEEAAARETEWLGLKRAPAKEAERLASQ